MEREALLQTSNLKLYMKSYSITTRFYSEVFFFQQGCTNPDYDNQGTFIFASGNWSTCKHLIILIHGSGRVKAGQWTRRYLPKQKSLTYLHKP